MDGSPKNLFMVFFDFGQKEAGVSRIVQNNSKQGIIVAESLCGFHYEILASTSRDALRSRAGPFGKAEWELSFRVRAKCGTPFRTKFGKERKSFYGNAYWVHRVACLLGGGRAAWRHWSCRNQRHRSCHLYLCFWLQTGQAPCGRHADHYGGGHLCRFPSDLRRTHGYAEVC